VDLAADLVGQVTGGRHAGHHVLGVCGHDVEDLGKLLEVDKLLVEVGALREEVVQVQVWVMAPKSVRLQMRSSASAKSKFIDIEEFVPPSLSDSTMAPVDPFSVDPISLRSQSLSLSLFLGDNHNSSCLVRALEENTYNNK